MKDVYGNAVRAGTVIIYPARKGSGMWLTQATVTRVNQWTERGSEWKWDSAKNRYAKCVATPVQRYSIEAIRDGVVDIDGRMVSPIKQRPVTLTRTTHIVVVQ